MEGQVFEGYTLRKQFVNDAIPSTSGALLNFEAWFAYAPAEDGSLFMAMWSPSYEKLLWECKKRSLLPQADDSGASVAVLVSAW